MKGSSSVAEDTAVAMLIAGTRLEVDAGTPVRLLVDGAATHLYGTSVRSLPGGGRFHADGQGDIFVKWPDGCTAAIQTFPGALNVFFGAPQRLVSDLHGLLNSVVTGASRLATDTVLLGGNGKRYLVDPTTTAGFRTIYRSFAPSWAVAKKDSLFTYPQGKSPRSYLVEGFPAHNYDAATVPAYQLGLYVKQCRADGVANGNLLRGCVIDQAALGTKYIDLVLRAIVRAFALYTLTQPDLAVHTAHVRAHHQPDEHELDRPTKGRERLDVADRRECVHRRGDRQASMHLAHHGAGRYRRRHAFRNAVRPRGYRPL